MARHYQNWDDIADPTEAERELKRCVEAGDPCELGPKDEIPPAPADWNDLTEGETRRHIRADVLRVILLQKGCTATEDGLRLAGAYISGPLRLDDCKIDYLAAFVRCQFQKFVRAQGSKWSSMLRFGECSLPAFDAAGAKIGGQLDLSESTLTNPDGDALNLQGAAISNALHLGSATIEGTAYLSGVKIGGQLNCTSTTFVTPDGTALMLQAGEIKTDIHLNDATIKGTADLTGTDIGGQLICDGATFDAPDDIALNLQTTNIQGVLLFRKGVAVRGAMSLLDCHAKVLVDDPTCYPPKGQLELDGLTYDRIVGPTDARTRLDWLERGSHLGGIFFPQPYKQLAKTLHDMGHEADARDVLYTLQVKLAHERHKRLSSEIADLAQTAPKPGLAIGKRLRLWTETAGDALLRHGIGYGYRPFLSLLWLCGLIAFCFILALSAWHSGGFAPNSAVILNSPEWHRSSQHANAAEHWTTTSIAGKDWETFHPLAYAADVVIPIVEFGQTDAWAPSTERGPLGVALWWLRWLFTGFGWVVTALGAAALTGIIKRE